MLRDLSVNKLKFFKNRQVGESMIYDVVVIGGGPSGLMASIAAGESGANVLLIDKGNKLGRKLAISGNGRFLYSAFSVFNNEDIISYFEGLGIKLKEEDHGRMFPVSNKAQSVVDALISELHRLRVTIRTNTAVKRVNYENNTVKEVVLQNGEA